MKQKTKNREIKSKMDKKNTLTCITVQIYC